MFQNVVPDSTSSCGPYSPKGLTENNLLYEKNNDVTHNHDTIGMVVVDPTGNMAGGTSTNGARHKVPGYAKITIN